MVGAHAASGPTLVLLRHGQSAGNAEDSFTGWLDVPLTERGAAEARRAGELLVEHGCGPRVVHTSELTRAVATAGIVTGVATAQAPPVRRTWRLNERHYGVLQGRGRADVREEFGADRFRRWRRGYRDVPPPLPADDPTHPSRDPRYAGVPADLLPSTESLADVCARLAPHWPVLAADLRERRSVLVVAHSNSLRALCMRLDGLSEREVEGLNLPTGVPLRYDLDERLRPRVRGGVYLDADAARAGIAEVLAQGRGPAVHRV